MRFNRAGHLVLLLGLGGCGATPARPSPSPSSPSPSPSSSPAPVAPKAAAPAGHLAPMDVLARVRDDFAACYARGKKNAPAMNDGKVTWLGAVDASGRPSCVVPIDDSGLSQEVEDCMAKRLESETFSAGEPWTFELPLTVRDGAVTPGQQIGAQAIDHIDVHGLTGAETVIVALVPRLSACVSPLQQSGSLRVIHVGARVGKEGRVACSLAAAATDLPADVRACVATTIGSAVFQPPTTGNGLVALPLKVMARR